MLVTQSSPSDTLVALLQAAERDVRGAEILRSEGLSESSAEAALHPPPLVLTEVGEGSEGEGIAWVGSLLLYVAILSFGTVVATAVVEEKATRVVEVILSAIWPIKLLTGKVFGIGLLGIGQVMLISGVGIAVALATGSIEMPDSTAETAVLVVVYFLLGYLMYAAAFAVTGAMVSRQEDVQSASAPLVIILIAGYLASISAIGDPSGTLAVVCTFLPPVAPMVVPGRAAQDALPGWELAVSLIAMVAFAVLLLWLAALDLRPSRAANGRAAERPVQGLELVLGQRLARPVPTEPRDRADMAFPPPARHLLRAKDLAMRATSSRSASMTSPSARRALARPLQPRVSPCLRRASACLPAHPPARARCGTAAEQLPSLGRRDLLLRRPQERWLVHDELHSHVRRLPDRLPPRFPPASNLALIPTCVVRAYSRPQHSTFREDKGAALAPSVAIVNSNPRRNVMLKFANAQLWVHDQDEALAFYTEKLGMEVRSDVTVAEMGNFRWLVVAPPGQSETAIVLMAIPEHRCLRSRRPPSSCGA